MDYTPEIASARKRKSIAQCMSAFFIERYSLNLSTSRDDLIDAGFKPEEIDRHGGAAKRLAGKSTERNLSRSAA